MKKRDTKQLTKNVNELSTETTSITTLDSATETELSLMSYLNHLL